MSGGNLYRTPPRKPERQADAADLELLAIEERFVAEYRAGRQPRLATYVAAYPRHAQALAAFVARYLDEDARNWDEGAADSDGEGAVAPLSAGTQRALDQLFPPAEAEARDRRAGERRVAEAPEAYAPEASPPSSVGVLALAEARGMTVEALAGALDLTPALVRWLDAASFAAAGTPPELVSRLASTLGITQESALAALEAGSGAPEAVGGRAFRAALLADATLSQKSRRRWLAALGDAG